MPASCVARRDALLPDGCSAAFPCRGVPLVPAPLPARPSERAALSPRCWTMGGVKSTSPAHREPRPSARSIRGPHKNPARVSSISGSLSVRLRRTHARLSTCGRGSNRVVLQTLTSEQRCWARHAPRASPARAGGFGSRRTSQYEPRPSDDATLDRLLRRAAASRRPDDPLRFDAPPPDGDDNVDDAALGRSDDQRADALRLARRRLGRPRPTTRRRGPRGPSRARPLRRSWRSRRTASTRSSSSPTGRCGRSPALKCTSLPRARRARTQGTRAEVRSNPRSRPSGRPRSWSPWWDGENRRERRGRHLPGPAREGGKRGFRGFDGGQPAAGAARSTPRAGP